MTSGIFLAISLTLALIPAAIAVVLSGELASSYTKLLQPGLLLVGCLLSLWVAMMYRADLRRAFLFLSAFLLLYGLVNIAPLVEQIAKALADNFLTFLISWQVTTYLMLFAACVSMLRAVGITTMGKWGIPVMSATLLLALGIVAKDVGPFVDQFQVNSKAAVLIFLIRIFDVLVLLMLVPVLLLYLEGARAKYQESATFAFVALGIIASLDFAYVYEIIKGQSITQIAQSEYQKGSVLDGLYIFMYLTVALGLYAHRMHQKWSLEKVEHKLLA